MSLQYSDKVKDEFYDPKNLGNLEKPDGVGELGNPACGDIMHMEIQVEDGVITDIKFKTFGCAAAIASSSMITQMVKGKTIEEADKISLNDIADQLSGLPPVKMHCSAMAAKTLKKAIEDYKIKNGLMKESEKSEDKEDDHHHE